MERSNKFGLNFTHSFYPHHTCHTSRVVCTSFQIRLFSLFHKNKKKKNVPQSAALARERMFIRVYEKFFFITQKENKNAERKYSKIPKISFFCSRMYLEYPKYAWHTLCFSFFKNITKPITRMINSKRKIWIPLTLYALTHIHPHKQFQQRTPFNTHIRTSTCDFVNVL